MRNQHLSKVSACFASLFRAMKKRRYSGSFLRHCFKTLQKKKYRDCRDLTLLITTFLSASRCLNGKLKSHFENILGKTGIIPNSKVISAYRRNKTLKDLFVRAKLSSLNWEKPQINETIISTSVYSESS